MGFLKNGIRYAGLDRDEYHDTDDSSDEDYVFADEYSRRTELFVGPDKESFVDLYWSSTHKIINSDDKCLSKISATVTDGVAHCKIKSVTEIKEFRQAQKTNEPRTLCGCQCFFIRQKNSNSRLSITRDLFEALRKERSIFNHIREHAMSYGFKVREDDIGPPRCRFLLHSSLREQPTRFELVYGLRYVERSGSQNPPDEWRVRQSAIYHSFSRHADGTDSETWLFLSASQKMEIQTRRHMKRLSRPKERTPFDLHLILIQTALSNWRWYIKSIVQRISEQTSRVVAATVGNGPNDSFIDFRINFEDQQILKVIEDQVLDLIIIWDSTLDTVNELTRRWQSIKSQIKSQNDIEHIANDLQDCMHEIRLYQGKTKTLLKRVQGTATLLSNLLEYENGKQTQNNGQSLKMLAQESRIENVTMRRLTEKGTRDAAAVKAITIITIVYLPTSVVAGFFSTQFVFQVTKENGRPKLAVAENWWVYVAVSLPLTIVTIAIWYAWIRYPWKTWWTDRYYRGWRQDDEAQHKSALESDEYVTTSEVARRLGFRHPHA